MLEISIDDECLSVCEVKNMDLITIIALVFVLAIGAGVGYFARQAIAKKRAGTIEKNIAGKLAKAKTEAQKISEEAQAKSQKLLEASRQEIGLRQREIGKTETLILKRESMLEQKIAEFEAEENEFQEKAKKLKPQISESLSQSRASLQKATNDKAVIKSRNQDLQEDIQRRRLQRLKD